MQPTMIASAQNPSYKWLKSLSQKKYREKEGVLVLEGERLVRHALAQGITPVALFLREDHTGEPLAEPSILEAQIKCYVLADQLFDTVSDTVHSQGLLGVFKQSDLGRAKSLSPHVLILDQLQDPGNLGTILRTCDALGITDIYLMKGTVDPFSPKVLRATMGSIFNVNLHCGCELDTIIALKEKGYALVATALRDSVPLAVLSSAVAGKPMALCLGNEGNGVSDAVLDLSDVRVTIPMRGGAESLNVAVAAAIVLYHVQSNYLV